MEAIKYSDTRLNIFWFSVEKNNHERKKKKISVVFCVFISVSTGELLLTTDCSDSLKFKYRCGSKAN